MSTPKKDLSAKKLLARWNRQRTRRGEAVWHPGREDRHRDFLTRLKGKTD